MNHAGLYILCLMALLSASAGAESNEDPLEYFGYRIVNTYPHDPLAFTQGLFFLDGALFESTGLRGQSTVRKVDLKTGAILQRIQLRNEYFGEGITNWDGAIIALTWQAGEGFVFDRETLTRTQSFSYEGEGWGLTQDGARLIMSDGTSILRFMNPETLTESGRLAVTLRGQPLDKLNELEWVNGEIFANVWLTEAIVRIDPRSGAITGIIDLHGLLPEKDRSLGQADVLNGVAYDADTDRLFVTGKNWPHLYEIELIAHGTQ